MIIQPDVMCFALVKVSAHQSLWMVLRVWRVAAVALRIRAHTDGEVARNQARFSLLHTHTHRVTASLHPKHEMTER